MSKDCFFLLGSYVARSHSSVGFIHTFLCQIYFVRAEMVGLCLGRSVENGLIKSARSTNTQSRCLVCLYEMWRRRWNRVEISES